MSMAKATKKIPGLSQSLEINVCSKQNVWEYDMGGIPLWKGSNPGPYVWNIYITTDNCVRTKRNWGCLLLSTDTEEHQQQEYTLNIHPSSLIWWPAVEASHLAMSGDGKEGDLTLGTLMSLAFMLMWFGGPRVELCLNSCERDYCTFFKLNIRDSDKRLFT